MEDGTYQTIHQFDDTALTSLFSTSDLVQPQGLDSRSAFSTKIQLVTCQFVSHYAENEDALYRQAVTYVRAFPPRPYNLDVDDIAFTLIDDVFKELRNSSPCKICDTTDKNEQAMTLCCQQYSCSCCYHKHLIIDTVHCYWCKMNWSAFKLSDVLLSPPIADIVETDNTTLEAQKQIWKKLVLKVFQDRQSAQ